MDIKELISRISGLSYEGIKREISSESDDTLLILLDGKGTKVGDTAASLLSRRNREDLIIDAVLDGSIRTAPGKVRAANTLMMSGIKLPRAIEAYRKLLNDRSDGVVSNALFGIVFMQNVESIPLIRTAAAHHPEDSRRRQRCLEAIQALEAGDPYLYSPYYSRDCCALWGLDPVRFAKRDS